jgi:hypothetical protein
MVQWMLAQKLMAHWLAAQVQHRDLTHMVAQQVQPDTIQHLSNLNWLEKIKRLRALSYEQIILTYSMIKLW